MILRVGLTGGIASGKSTVARLLGELGCRVVDADQIVHQLYRPGEAGHRALVAQYGKAVLAEDGTVDRRKLATVALSTAEGAATLNRLIHPLVIDEQQRILDDYERNSGDGIGVVEATLLIESGGKDRFDKIVVVDASPEIQLDRAEARGLPRSEAALRMSRQIDRAKRLEAADYVINNDRDVAALEEQTRKVFDVLRAALLEKKRLFVGRQK